MDGTPRYEIEHVSRYVYALRVRHCVMSLCLRPRNGSGQRLLRFEIETTPAAALNEEIDGFGNTKHGMSIHQEHDALEIITRSTVETSLPAPLPDSLGAGAWDEIRSWKATFSEWDFTHASAFARPSPALAAFVDRMGIGPTDDPLDSLLRLSDTLHHTFYYVPGSTSAVSPIEHILESGRGVCQDYVHVMIAIARSWGVPARYVSGYLQSDGEQIGAEPASHAWVECRLPEIGWTGFDPTNQDLSGEQHIRIAVGRDYRDVAPTRGVIVGGGESSLGVEVRMRQVGMGE